MKYEGADFLVAISGQKKNTDGLDNYQFQEIATAFAQEMYNITGLHAESAYVCYGEYGTVKDEKNGMIHTFYDGENLAEVLQKESARAVVSYANQDVEQIPVSQISQKTGVVQYCLRITRAGKHIRRFGVHIIIWLAGRLKME